MKRAIALLSSFLIIISATLLPYSVMAATPVNVSVNKNEVRSGDTVTVIVGANVNLGTFNCTIRYDSSRMEFLPSSSTATVSNPEDGRLKAVFVTMGGSDVSGNGMFTLVFKAKSLEGTAIFTIEEAIAANYAGDKIPLGGGSNSVTVKSDSIPPVTLPPTTASTTPKQSPLTTVATVEATTTTTVETEETETETTKTFKAVDHRGRSLSLPEVLPEEADIPSGFETAERTIDGNMLAGFYSESEDLFLSFLSLSGQGPQLYFYETSNKCFIPYLRFQLGEDFYHATLMPDELMPYGTTRSNVDIRGVNFPVIEFNFGDYISFDEYMQQYQAQLSISESATTVSEQKNSNIVGNPTTLNVEIDGNNDGTYLLALRGRNNNIERFIYSMSLDQLMHYDLLLVPAFGTFLDKDFENLAKGDPEGPVLQEETTSAATEIASSELSYTTEETQKRIVNLFGRDFELSHIIAAGGGVLLILGILIVILIKFNSDRKRAEFPFADEFLSIDSMHSSEEDSLDEVDDSEAENFRPVDYNYPDDFPEVTDISDITSKTVNSLSEGYQEKEKELFSGYRGISDQEDQEEI